MLAALKGDGKGNGSGHGMGDEGGKGEGKGNGEGDRKEMRVVLVSWLRDTIFWREGGRRVVSFSRSI